MKAKLLILSALALFLSSTAWAYDFFAVNDDGKILYYNIVDASEKTCETTYLYYGWSQNSEAYKGDIVIPETATFNGTTYTVVSIGGYTFEYCSLTSVTIPSSVTRINYWAFYNAGLPQITIPETVTEIRSGAFSKSSLKQITLPNNMTTIPSLLFQDCTSLTEVTIPENVTEIEYEAFYGCLALTEITIPEAVTTIGDYAFYCTNLRKVNFNATDCTSLSSNAFYGTGSITTLSIGDKVTTIPNNIFQNRSNLEKLTLGKSVTTVGVGAFSGCSALLLITSLNPEPPNCRLNALKDAPTSTCFLSVPEGSKEAYSTATIWEDFLNIETGSVDGRIDELVMKLYDYGLDCQTDKISTDESFYIGFKVLNTSKSTAHSGSYRFGLCDKDGIVKEWISSIYETSSTHDEPIQPNWWFSIYSWQCKITSKIEAGDKIRLFYEEDYSELWKHLTPYSDEVVWEIVLDDYTGVKDINSGGNAEAEGYYTLDGKQVPTLQRGVTIVRYSDGTARKVLVK